MATLYVCEYERAAEAYPAHGVPQIAEEPPVAEQTVSFSTSTQSNAFGASTRIVRIHTDAICSIAFGTNPTATTSKKRMAANTTEYFAVPAGASYKVAAITNT